MHSSASQSVAAQHGDARLATKRDKVRNEVKSVNAAKGRTAAPRAAQQALRGFRDLSRNPGSLSRRRDSLAWPPVSA
jgi:hypothetical protein